MRRSAGEAAGAGRLRGGSALKLLAWRVAVLGGTLLGDRILLGMTMERFRQVAFLAILPLGVLLLIRPDDAGALVTT